MPIRFLVLFLIANFALFACSNDKTIYIKTHLAYGIGEKTKIELYGTEIGEITDVAFDKDGIVFEATIRKDVIIPKDSKCTIKQKDIFIQTVAIQKGKSKRFLADGDTIQFDNKPVKTGITIDDKAIEKTKEIFKEVSGMNQRDSMIRQLEQLNKSLEEIDKDLKKMNPDDY